jgi:uncharacterized protein YndB with AHSA1/START domain
MPDIIHNFIIKAAPQKIFDAFCLPEGLDSWWPLSSAGSPQLGNSYTFYFGPEYDWRAEVVHQVPGKELTWKMTKTMDDWIGTQVGYKLEARDGGTFVHFFHKGWREASEHFGIATFCWGTLLNGLKQFVEKGIVVPHGLRN